MNNEVSLNLRRVQLLYITSTLSWITEFLYSELIFHSRWEKFSVTLLPVNYKNTYFFHARFHARFLVEFFVLSNKISYINQSVLTGYVELIYFASLFSANLVNFTLMLEYLYTVYIFPSRLIKSTSVLFQHVTFEKTYFFQDMTMYNIWRGGGEGEKDATKNYLFVL